MGGRTANATKTTSSCRASTSTQGGRNADFDRSRGAGALRNGLSSPIRLYAQGVYQFLRMGAEIGRFDQAELRQHTVSGWWIRACGRRGLFDPRRLQAEEAQASWFTGTRASSARIPAAAARDTRHGLASDTQMVLQYIVSLGRARRRTSCEANHENRHSRSVFCTSWAAIAWPACAAVNGLRVRARLAALAQELGRTSYRCFWPPTGRRNGGGDLTSAAYSAGIQGRCSTACCHDAWLRGRHRLNESRRRFLYPQSSDIISERTRAQSLVYTDGALFELGRVRSVSCAVDCWSRLLQERSHVPLDSADTLQGNTPVAAAGRTTPKLWQQYRMISERRLENSERVMTCSPPRQE